ncbi:duf614 family protein-related [Anaeramoeba flamelloides]|uniref:Duf614 family protein-related n=1 Tax=Anaeramoeba flamelloides TaxID=1746091 RepID=A0ABQ8YI92_9EUKA|nr:duf614 family protein-related [Anaeramoeba flamelloides]
MITSHHTTIVTTYWGSSLLGCFSNPKICLMTLFCMPCQLAKNKASVDQRECTICDCLCGPREYFTRQQIRSKYGFEQATLMDCIVTGPCLPCAVCQDAREIEDRGSMVR